MSGKLDICKAKTKRGKSGRFEVDVAALTKTWERKLKNCGLTMDRARFIGSGEIIYGQDISVLDFFDAQSKYELQPDQSGERTELD